MKNIRKTIFVVGNSRSGTTLIANILGNNSYVHTFNELHFSEHLWVEKNPFVTKKHAKKILHRLFCSSRVHPFKSCKKIRFMDEIEKCLENKTFPVNGLELFRDFLFYETEKKGKKIPCEQTPRNLFYLNAILEFFPEAKIIYMVRDPRDTLLSQKFKWKRYFKAKNEPYPFFEAFRNFINYHPITVSLLWRSSASFIIPYLSNPNVKCVKFEELIFEPKKIVVEVCDFIEVKFEKKMLDVPYAFSSIYEDEEKKGFDRRRTGNWEKKLNSAEVFFIEKITGNLMEKFGYQKSNKSPNPILVFYYLFTLLPKTFFAFIFNLSRNKNIFYSIYKRIGVLLK